MIKITFICSIPLPVLIVAIFLSFSDESNAAGGAIRIPKNEIVKNYATAAEYGKPILKYKESPELAKLVKEKKLPSVQERLPKEPAIVTPAKNIGKYGGTIRRAWKGIPDIMGVNKFLGERLLLWGANGEITPGVIKGLEMSPDGMTLTMYLREGLKWSDGQPVTTEDLDFQFNKVYKNSDLFRPAVIPNVFKPGGVLAELKVVDKYTCIFKFQAPAATFLPSAAGRDYTDFMQPAHYLKQFHPEYTDKDTLDKYLEESGDTNLITFYANKAQPFSNPDLPVLMAWQLQNDVTDQLVAYKRNPYYFKIDTDGNQLPYVNEVVNCFVQDDEKLILKAVSGELDFQTRDLTLASYTLFIENKENGKYNVLLYPGADGSNVAIFLNHNVKNEVKKELFNNPTFKQALSIGMNRKEVSNVNHMGMALARQAAFSKDGYIYDKEWEALYTKHDPSKANKLLDELELTQRDKDGIRLMKDSTPLEITIEFFLENYTKDMEIVAKQWQKIGVKLIPKLEERSLMYKRYRQENSHEALCWTFNMIIRPDLNPGHWAPVSESNGWGGQWGLYYKTKGKSGIQPLPDVQRLQYIWDEIQITMTDSKKNALMQEVINIHKKNLFIIGVVGLSPSIAIVNKNLRNIPYFIFEEAYRSPGNAYPQQWYYEKK